MKSESKGIFGGINKFRNVTTDNKGLIIDASTTNMTHKLRQLFKLMDPADNLWWNMYQFPHVIT